MAQLDEISVKIGEIGTYVHEHKHGINNLSVKFDALALDLTKRVEALDARMMARISEVSEMLRKDIEAVSTRTKALEIKDVRREGASRVFGYLVTNWPNLAGMAVVIAVVLEANGKL